MYIVHIWYIFVTKPTEVEWYTELELTKAEDKHVKSIWKKENAKVRRNSDIPRI
jgi:hypothetical protein